MPDSTGRTGSSPRTPAPLIDADRRATDRPTRAAAALNTGRPAPFARQLASADRAPPWATAHRTDSHAALTSNSVRQQTTAHSLGQIPVSTSGSGIVSAEEQGNSPDRGPSPHSRTRGRTAVSRCCAARACKTSTCDPWRDRPVSAKSSERPRTRFPYKSKTYGSMLFASVRRNSTPPACRFTPWFTPRVPPAASPQRQRSA